MSSASADLLRRQRKVKRTNATKLRNALAREEADIDALTIAIDTLDPPETGEDAPDAP